MLPLLLLITSAICLLSGCSGSDETTRLDIEITKQPEGGKIIFIVKAELRARLNFSEATGLFKNSGSPEKITAKVEWFWTRDEVDNVGTLMKTESFDFSSQEWKTFSSSMLSSTETFLTDYFWARISWKNHDGDETEHELLTDKVFCAGY